MADNELRVDSNGYPLDMDEYANAVDLAADQGERTWLVNEEGKRIAALVPVDEAEETERRHEEFMASMTSLVQAGKRDRRTADQHGEDRVS